MWNNSSCFASLCLYSRDPQMGRGRRQLLGRRKVLSLNLYLKILIDLFLAALDLCCFARAFSCCGEQGLLSDAVLGLLIVVASLVAQRGLYVPSLQQLWRPGLLVPQHAGSSWTRDQTRVPCTGRWTLVHCTTREICHTSSKRLSYLRNHRTVSTSCEHPILGKSLLP